MVKVQARKKPLHSDKTLLLYCGETSSQVLPHFWTMSKKVALWGSLIGLLGVLIAAPLLLSGEMSRRFGSTTEQVLSDQIETNPPSLSVVRKEDKLIVSGVLPDEGIAKRMLASIRSEVPKLTVVDKLAVDLNVDRADWLASVQKMVRIMGTPGQSNGFVIENDVFSITGPVRNAKARAKMGAELRQLVPNMEFVDGLSKPSTGEAVATKTPVPAAEKPKPKPVPAPPKVSVRPSVQKPAVPVPSAVPKPKPKPAPKAVAKPAPKPAPKPVAKPAPKPVAKSVAKPTKKPVAKPKAAIKHAKPTVRKASKKKTYHVASHKSKKRVTARVRTIKRATLAGIRSGTARLSASQRAKLRSLARTLKTNKRLRAKIVGHTDSVGSRRLNQRLSAARAAAARAYLRHLGVPRSRITVKACGERHPIASNHSSYGRELNRRVEAAVYSVSGVRR
jgi:outer membrane protein OmpA-like peptidoglycan-associated protein